MVKQVDCTGCDFLIRDENEDELIEFVRTHSENSHGYELSEAEIRESITEV